MKHSSVAHPAKLARYALSLMFLFNVFACVSVPVSYFDPVTHTRLTSLKAELTTLVTSFDSTPFAENEQKIEKATANLQTAYEYELSKGAPNSDTARQVEKIRSLFRTDVQDYRENQHGELGRNYFAEAAKVLGQAFDIAIATENQKNKQS